MKNRGLCTLALSLLSAVATSGNLDSILGPPGQSLYCGFDREVRFPGPPGQRGVVYVWGKQCKSLLFVRGNADTNGNPAADAAVHLAATGAFAAFPDAWRWSTHACRGKVGSYLIRHRDVDLAKPVPERDDIDCWADAMKRAGEAGQKDPTFAAIMEVQRILDTLDVKDPAEQLKLARTQLLLELQPLIGGLSFASGLLGNSDRMDASEYRCFTTTMSLLLISPASWPSLDGACSSKSVAMVFPGAPYAAGIGGVRKTRIADAWLVEISDLRFHAPSPEPPPWPQMGPFVSVGLCDADEQGRPTTFEPPLVSPLLVEYQMGGDPSSPSRPASPAARAGDVWTVDRIQAVVPQPRYDDGAATWLCVIVQGGSHARYQAFLAHEAVSKQHGCGETCGSFTASKSP